MSIPPKSLKFNHSAGKQFWEVVHTNHQGMVQESKYWNRSLRKSFCWKKWPKESWFEPDPMQGWINLFVSQGCICQNDATFDGLGILRVGDKLGIFHPITFDPVPTRCFCRVFASTDVDKLGSVFRRCRIGDFMAERLTLGINFQRYWSWGQQPYSLEIYLCILFFFFCKGMKPFKQNGTSGYLS